MGNALRPIASDDYPESHKPPSFDPQLGFPNGRKKRVMIATEQEMRAARVPLYFRDYCAHKYIDYLQCQRQHYPFVKACKPQRNAYLECQVDDGIMRMKEYERERRLRRREKSKGQGMTAMTA